MQRLISQSVPPAVLLHLAKLRKSRVSPRCNVILSSQCPDSPRMGSREGLELGTPPGAQILSGHGALLTGTPFSSNRASYFIGDPKGPRLFDPAELVVVERYRIPLGAYVPDSTRLRPRFFVAWPTREEPQGRYSPGRSPGDPGSLRSRAKRWQVGSRDQSCAGPSPDSISSRSSRQTPAPRRPAR